MNIHRYKYILASVTLPVVFSACQHLGEQPPENVAFMLSKDGSGIVRQYRVFHVSSYTQQGGKTERIGYSTNYFECYDGITGELRSPQPFSLRENCQLLQVTNSRVWLQVYNRSKNTRELLALTLPDLSRSFDANSLAQKNNGLTFGAIQTFYNPPGIEGVLFQGDDARIYTINETTGMATVIPDSIQPRGISRRFLQMNAIHLVDQNISFTGNQRKKIITKSRLEKNKAPILSASDFINPYFAGYYDAPTAKELPFTIGNNLLVVSKTKSGYPFEFQIACVDTANLTTTWSTTIPAPNGENSENNLQDIQPLKQQLLVVTKNTLGSIDTRTGRFTWVKTYE